jgi:hypothetical protein
MRQKKSGKTCGGENQSNDIEATTAHDFRPKFIVMFHIWLWIKYARGKY